MTESIQLRGALLPAFAACLTIAVVAGCQGSAIETGSTPITKPGDGGGGTITPTPGDAPTCKADADCASLASAPCLAAGCHAASKRCVVGQAPEFSTCDDGDPCTTESLCRGGTCRSGRAVDCPDGGPCGVGACDPASGGCVVAPTKGPCDDGNPCTVGEACAAGGCVGGHSVCACTSDADCAAASGGDKCVTLQCSQGGCVADPTKTVQCPDGGPCAVSACDPASGSCTSTPLPDKIACDDANPCTVGDFCSGGGCVGIAELPCGKESPCVATSCDPKKGCVAEASKDGAACDDGNACTSDDACAAGVCGGKPTCTCALSSECAANSKLPACLGTAVCVAGTCGVNPALGATCEEGGECSVSVCTASGCKAENAGNNAPCDDGNACTLGDRCSALGFCQNGQGGKCDDSNPCTDDSCDSEEGCNHTVRPDGQACDDGIACSTASSCKGGACVGTVTKCDDGLPCTFDWCDPAAPDTKCVHVALGNGTSCDDGDACTVDETCDEGLCVPGQSKACDDANDCTLNSCTTGTDGQLACDFPPLPATASQACDDGDPCTAGDLCNAGACDGSPGACECVEAKDCATKEDGDLCNGTLICAAGKCVLDPLTVVACGASDNPCTERVCHKGSGQCVDQPKAEVGGGNKVPCDDGNACTSGEVCLSGGACGGGSATLCDDGDSCTVDLCDPVTGCTAKAAAASDGLPCDDGNFCTKGDVCGPAGCEPGKNTCQCQVNADCAVFDDNDLCNGALVCEAGACVSDGKEVQCTGQSAPACQAYRCVPATGACSFVALPNGVTCTEGDPCPAPGTCASGKCGVTGPACDDANPCTTDACGATGCSNTPATGSVCSDGDACTDKDTCAADGTCVSGKDICTCAKDADCPDDGDPCNGVAACIDSTCGVKAGSAVVCDKSGDTPCQTNTCNKASGACAMVQKPGGSACDDGDACTDSTTCSGATCGGGSTLTCDDSNPCTSDACSPAQGCIFLNDTALCDDGNPCTSNDRCSAGQCVPGPNTCDCTSNAQCSNDANLCNGTVICVGGKCQLDPKTVVSCDKTNDSDCRANLCDEKTGKCALTSFPEGTQCTDSDVCTSKDRCQAGVCKGDAASCDDNNPCSVDKCDPQAGCSNTAIDGGACDDANACTSGETCNAGVCSGGKDVCGTCNVDADCAKNDDGNLCNGVLECAGGKCAPKSGSEVTCSDDGNPCTVQACVPATGLCVSTPIGEGGACDDNNKCTTASACSSGQCLGSGALDCDDGKVCTADSCDPGVGCVHAPRLGQGCDDGNSCTTGDVCVNADTCTGLNTCDCQADADCAKSEDGDACNGTLSCQANKCAIKPGSVVTCDPSKDTACRKAACDPKNGTCGVAAVADDTACDDGSACTTATHCKAGQCAGTALSCDDGNSCTTDSCDASKGCQSAAVANGQGCDDGQKCTESDTCQSGACIAGKNVCQCQATADCQQFEDGDLCNGTLTCSGNVCVVDLATVVTCTDDGNPCTASACDSKTGKCSSGTVNDGTACGGAVLCGGTGACQKGACSGPSGCSDGGNPCVNAVCDGKGGCSTTPISGACDDGHVCTTNDACVGGTCTGQGQCNCSKDADCTGFDDGDRCNGVYTCQSGKCAFDATTIVKCPASPGPCATVACQSSTGQCVTKLQPNGASCNDGDACTSGEQCVSGKCSGTKINCDDNNTCTNDTCDSGSGCKNTATTGSLTCDDGDPCTPVSACIGGKCQGFVNQCTCSSDAQCSDDNNKCNGVPSCQAGTCKPKPGTVVECADSTVPCFVNECVPATGNCQSQPAQTGSGCDDGNACTAGEVCTLGKCVGIAVECDDKITCTADSCDPKTGCANAARHDQCNDNNACTLDECDTTTGCRNIATIGAPCDDGSSCTAGEKCNASPKGAVCSGGVPLQCNDDNPCTNDACGGTGCVFTPHDGQCDDGDACTTADKCSAGKCTGAATDCADNDPCTVDSCDKQSGSCAHTPNNGGACDDGDACTAGSTCKGGACGGGQPITCDDGNTCTTDSCDKAKGCVTTPKDQPCDDKNPCTVGDACSGGFCNAGPPKDCDDNNSCTLDKCNDVTGNCENTTGSGTCDDKDPCTTDSCDVQSGKCVTTPNPGAGCDDGDDCTAKDTCDTNGKCVGAGGCNDGNACTNDACTSGKCAFVPNTDPCDDGNSCTQGEACKDGACQAPAPATNCCAKVSDCDDDYACTTDACTSGQCSNDVVACKDDGNDCTIEACKAGSCQSIVPGEFAPVSYYAESFDDNQAGGTRIQTDNKDVAWHISTRASKTSPRSLHAANVDKGTYDFGAVSTTFDLPPISLSAAGSAQLRFFYKATFADAGCSKDRMTVTITSGALSKSSQYCDSTNGFVAAVIDLGAAPSDFRGKVVQVRFSFGTVDASNNGAEGVFLDDIELLGTTTGGACCQGPTDCFDGNQCTFDACDSKTGQCTNNPNVGAFCDDNSKCTSQDTCSAQGQCQGIAINCSDGNACTADTCDPATGKCENPDFTTFQQDFETDFEGFSVTSSNAQIKWQLSTKQPNTGKSALYVGNINDSGVHSYNFGPTVATATYKAVTIPSTAKKAFVRFKYRFSNGEPPGCVNQPIPSDRLQLLVNGQTAEETCTGTTGYEQVEFDLKDHIGKTVTLGLRFIANLAANNGEGAWFDNWEVGWTCN